MTGATKLSLTRLIAGLTFLTIGLAVFAIRLQHPGAYAVPTTGVLLGSIATLLIGTLLLWPNIPRLLLWLAVLTSPPAVFVSIYSIVGELEEVISLYATDAEGTAVELRLWIVDREDGAWVGMPRDKAIEHDLHGNPINMLRRGDIYCVIPMLSDDRATTATIHAMKVDKYAAAQAAAAIGLYPREASETTAALRLDDCNKAQSQRP